MAYCAGIPKGSIIAVEPIRKQKDIKAIARMLKSRPRDHLLFILGVNNGARMVDLVRLRYKQVEGLKPGAVIKIIESKTGKQNILVINKSVHKALELYVHETNPSPEDYLFPSRKGNGHITSHTVGNMIREWTSAINLKGNYGCHTLRKTWGFHMRVNFGAGYEILCKRYNHSSPAITMRYLGIEDKEIHELLMNEVG